MATTSDWAVHTLTENEMVEAIMLFDREIWLFAAQAFAEPWPERDEVRRWMLEDMGVVPPADTWLGISVDGALVGAIHASVHYGQTAPQLHPASGADPKRVLYNALDVAFLEDLAVDPRYRGRGVGRALVDAAMAELKDRQARTVVGFACDQDATVFFASVGFTVGGFRQPVPKKTAGGMPTAYAGPDQGRYFFWRALGGAAFFRN